MVAACHNPNRPFISAMPFEADLVIWKTLLSVCKIHWGVEVAELATSKMFYN
jgi:hypothetical protein